MKKETYKQTAVEWLEKNIGLDMSPFELIKCFDKAKEMEKQNIIDFVDWLTRYDSPYGIMWGNQPERFCTENKNFTIEQVYDEYIKRKTETRP